MTEDQRYSRHYGLFGEEGQDAMAAKHVAIVGLGGLGSHVGQQLAYLGVQRFTLIDDDVVTLSNLNRLIGSVKADADASVPKVQVAERLIKAVLPEASVLGVCTRVETAEAQAALLPADWIFGCVDRDLVRLKLTEVCARAKKPYADLATDTDLEGAVPVYGGHVLIADAGERCLVCMKLLSQREMARDAMTPEERALDDRIYGVKRAALGGTGPSVVSLNGTVASLGVTEFMAWATGLRPVIRYLIYRGDRGRVTASTDRPEPYCYYCQLLWGGPSR
jgi:molybdopterin/thiamine biosynthesis adenylyltransferase